MSKLIAGSTGNTTELDLGSEISIPLTFKMADVKTPSVRSGAFSKIIKLPGTRINNAFFGGLYDFNADFTQFNPNVRTPCVLTVDNKEVLNGFIQLKSIDLDDLKNIDYNIVIYDDTVNFITDIGSLLVVGNSKDLTEQQNNAKSKNDIKFNNEPSSTPPIVRDTQVNMNHFYEYGRLVNSWALDSDAWEAKGYFYPLLYSTKNILKITDFQPAIYHKTLLDGIIKHHGYTWSGSLKNSNKYAREVIPYTGLAPKESTALADVRTFKAGVSLSNSVNIFDFDAPDPTTYFGGVNTSTLLNFSDETGLGFDDSNNNWNAISTYTAKNLGKYFFNANINFVTDIDYNKSAGIASGAPISHALQLHLFAEVYNASGVLQFSTDPLMIGTSQIELSPNVSSNHNDFDYVLGSPADFRDVRSANNIDNLFFELGVNWTVVFKAGIFSAGLTRADGNGYAGSVYDIKALRVFLTGLTATVPSYVECKNVRNDVSEWQYIDYSNFIPKKLKQMDIINDLIVRYNCFVYTNPENPNDIIFDIAEDFYNTGPVLDWSNKKDNTQRDQVKLLSDAQSGSALLSYKEASDSINSNYTDASSEVFGQFEFDFDNDFNRGVNEIITPFEPTPLVMQGNGDPSIVPALSANQTTANFRVLYAAEDLINPGTTTPDKYFTLRYRATSATSITSTVQRFTYPYAGCFNYPVDPATITSTSFKPSVWESINFGQLAFLNQFQNNNQPEITFESLYWRNTFKQISISKLLKARFYLTSSDVDFVRINPNARVWVDNKYWRINIINFEGNDNIRRLTIVELVSIE